MNSRGAILLSVLVVLMILSFMLLSLSSVLESRLDIAQKSSQMLNDRAAAYAKAQELTYLIATQRLTRAGVSRGTNPQGAQRHEDGMWVSLLTGDEIRSDSYIYTEQNLQYYLQNESGLISFNAKSQYWLKRLLSAYLRNFGDVNRLADTLHDYADEDTLQKPSGAEAAEYHSENMSVPKNFLLQTCSELQLILGWSELINSNPDILSHCGLQRITPININSIPISLWQKLWPNSADAVADMRNENSWFILPQDILSLEPAMNNVPEHYSQVIGGNTFIVHVASGNAAYLYRVTRGNHNAIPFTIRPMPKYERQNKFE